jgi:hypothetical protein
VWNTATRQVVGKLSNSSWIGRKETKTLILIDTDKNVIIVAKITEKLNKQCYVNPNENEKSNVRKIEMLNREVPLPPPPPARSTTILGKGILISV